MKTNPELIAPCGLYCGVCGVYYATQDNNQKFLEKIVNVYKSNMPGMDSLKPEDLLCDGCLSGRVSVFCRVCSIKDCTHAKGFEGCNECESFPCEHIDNFPMPVGKKVILRAVPYWREHGKEKWIEDEEARYYCPECRNKIFRGAKRCNKCGIEVNLD
ncbi:MAG: DUF3795 domain-containing protein [Desulfobacterales bacterium]